jgi:hypothetical protein
MPSDTFIYYSILALHCLLYFFTLYCFITVVWSRRSCHNNFYSQYLGLMFLILESTLEIIRCTSVKVESSSYTMPIIYTIFCVVTLLILRIFMLIQSKFNKFSRILLILIKFFFLSSIIGEVILQVKNIQGCIGWIMMSYLTTISILLAIYTGCLLKSVRDKRVLQLRLPSYCIMLMCICLLVLHATQANAAFQSVAIILLHFFLLLTLRRGRTKMVMDVKIDPPNVQHIRSIGVRSIGAKSNAQELNLPNIVIPESSNSSCPSSPPDSPESPSPPGTLGSSGHTGQSAPFSSYAFKPHTLALRNQRFLTIPFRETTVP